MKKIDKTGDYNDEIQQGIRTGIETFIKTQTW
jgi:hypothetical protein